MINQLILLTDDDFRSSLTVGRTWAGHEETKIIEYCPADDDGPERFMITPVEGRIFYIVASAVESFEPTRG